jgi:hypothetical protein
VMNDVDLLTDVAFVMKGGRVVSAT